MQAAASVLPGGSEQALQGAVEKAFKTMADAATREEAELRARLQNLQQELDDLRSPKRKDGQTGATTTIAANSVTHTAAPPAANAKDMCDQGSLHGACESRSSQNEVEGLVGNSKVEPSPSHGSIMDLKSIPEVLYALQEEVLLLLGADDLPLFECKRERLTQLRDKLAPFSKEVRNASAVPLPMAESERQLPGLSCVWWLYRHVPRQDILSYLVENDKACAAVDGLWASIHACRVLASELKAVHKEVHKAMVSQLDLTANKAQRELVSENVQANASSHDKVQQAHAAAMAAALDAVQSSYEPGFKRLLQDLQAGQKGGDDVQEAIKAAESVLQELVQLDARVRASIDSATKQSDSQADDPQWSAASASGAPGLLSLLQPSDINKNSDGRSDLALVMGAWLSHAFQKAGWMAGTTCEKMEAPGEHVAITVGGVNQHHLKAFCSQVRGHGAESLHDKAPTNE